MIADIDHCRHCHHHHNCYHSHHCHHEIKTNVTVQKGNSVGSETRTLRKAEQDVLERTEMTMTTLRSVTILGSENCQSISLQNLLSASQPF